LEPVGRNTAPVIALAALMAEDDPLLEVLAADQVIQEEAAFTNAVVRARFGRSWKVSNLPPLE
jgi:mannose-1-phosphate guanylyltransferase